MADEKYIPGEGWYDGSLNPKYGYRHGISPSNHITNGCGIGFLLHGSTRREEIKRLVALLDAFEEACDEEGIEWSTIIAKMDRILKDRR